MPFVFLDYANHQELLCSMANFHFTALFSEFGNAYLKHVASISPGNDLVRIVIGVVSPVSTVLRIPCTYRIDLCTLRLAFLWQEILIGGQSRLVTVVGATVSSALRA